jgi:uncharacterized protein
MQPEEAPGNTDYRALAARMGYGPLRARLKKQAGLWAEDVHQGRGLFSLDSFFSVDRAIWSLLGILRLQDRAIRNFLDFRIVENDLPVRGLHPAFEGFRLLQLADLHCDLHPGFAGALAPVLDSLHYDAAVFTGDYHNKIAAPAERSLTYMKEIVARVHTPRFAILGNHDFIEKVAFLEAIGLPVLLNEAGTIDRGTARLWFCGIDDPHYFQAGDLVRARARVPADAACILLSHSPEPYREAEQQGFSTMLCGHTHGGQICLPGGVPVIRNARIPQRFVSGTWKYKSLTGYTSRGTGACGVPARFHCPPEITIHTLTRQPACRT